MPYELYNIRIVELTADVPLRTDRDAVDAIAMTSAYRPAIVVIPTEHLNVGFFRLTTRIAGEFIQKFFTYKLHLVIMGDVSAYTRNSPSFRDFVYECNTGSHLWFVAGVEELEERLEPRLRVKE